jgi:hypothetical protein
MNDRPHAAELIEAVREFMERELLPTLSDARLKFQTLVAMDVLRLAQRESTSEEAALVAEWSLLSQEPRPETLTNLRRAIHEKNEELCHQIRQGEYVEEELLRLLREQIRLKREVIGR